MDYHSIARSILQSLPPIRKLTESSSQTRRSNKISDDEMIAQIVWSQMQRKMVLEHNSFKQLINSQSR